MFPLNRRKFGLHLSSESVWVLLQQTARFALHNVEVSDPLCTSVVFQNVSSCFLAMHSDDFGLRVSRL